MASLLELLKSVENSGEVGFKNGAWFPHASAEGGTRTIAYGHKLSQNEDAGDYVELPDGSVVDLSQRGLTRQEAQDLLANDVIRHKRVAEAQWNAFQPVEFNTLPPLYQALLTEITFNIGTLKSGGKWGWPSLAKGIMADDIEEVKAQISRSFVDNKGQRRQLTTRVNEIRAFVDEYVQNPNQVALEGFTVPTVPTAPTTPTGPSVEEFADTLMSPITEAMRGAQEASEAGPVDRIDQLAAVLAEQWENRANRERGEQMLQREANEAMLAHTAKQAEASVSADAKDKSSDFEKNVEELLQIFEEGEVVRVNQNKPIPDKPQPQEIDWYDFELRNQIL